MIATGVLGLRMRGTEPADRQTDRLQAEVRRREAKGKQTYYRLEGTDGYVQADDADRRYGVKGTDRYNTS